jgi:hypothetical protein
VKLGTAIRRFLIPGFVVQWIYFLRCRALVSARAEVELSSKARLGYGQRRQSGEAFVPFWMALQSGAQAPLLRGLERPAPVGEFE